MAENGPAVCGDVVLSVCVNDCRCFGFRVDAPFLCKKAAIQHIGGGQADRGDEDDYKCVHNYSLLVSIYKYIL